MIALNWTSTWLSMTDCASTGVKIPNIFAFFMDLCKRPQLTLAWWDSSKHIVFFRVHCQIGKMSKAHPPELKKFMDKRVHLRINGGREVSSWFFQIQCQTVGDISSASDTQLLSGGRHSLWFWPLHESGAGRLYWVHQAGLPSILWHRLQLLIIGSCS